MVQTLHHLEIQMPANYISRFLRDYQLTIGLFPDTDEQIVTHRTVSYLGGKLEII